MLKTFFLSIFFFLAFVIFAQNKTQDIVYLKNGSVIYGKITAEKAGEFVKILVTDTHELFFPMDEVKSISYGKDKIAEDDNEMPKKKKAIYYKEKGIYVNIFGSYGFGGTVHGDRLMTNTNIVAGYMFNRHIGLGLGTGSYWYHVSGRHAPFYLEARGEFLRQKRLVPIYYGRLGYGVVIGTSGITSELRSGLFWNVGIGYKEYTTRKHQWIYTVGFQSQSTYQKWSQERWVFDPITGTATSTIYDIEGTINLLRIAWAWGIMF